MKRNLLFLMILPLFIVACNDNKWESVREDFELSETSLSFESQSAEKTIGFVNPKGKTTVETVSKESEWCTVKVVNDSVVVSVSENILVKNRNAIINVISGGESKSILVRQSPKYFTTIAAVKQLEIIPGYGQVTLRWVEPTEDNFSHVTIEYTKGDQDFSITVESGTTEQVISDLRSTDGEYTFKLQSVDKQNDIGETVNISAQVLKLVAFRFEKDMKQEWLPFYLKAKNDHITKVRLGSDDFNMDEQVEIQITIDEDELAKYNTENNTQFKLLPKAAFSVADNYTFKGEMSYQDIDIQLDLSSLENDRQYALPITIKSASSGTINEAMNTAMLLYYVDDLSGWYTVDRLAKSGEGAGSYPSNPNDRRRYIKRTGPTTWETGYLFRSYVAGENSVLGSKTNRQFISINPTTKAIHIQQGDYSVRENSNLFNTITNEFNIEYLYMDWAGWWNHERMYKRSFTK